MNIEVDDDDFAPPFSAPHLRDLWLFNCGPQSLSVAELFFKEGLAADLPPPPIFTRFDPYEDNADLRPSPICFSLYSSFTGGKPRQGRHL